MIIARWHLLARFGMRQEVIDKIKQWWSTIGREIGQTDYRSRPAASARRKRW